MQALQSEIDQFETNRKKLASSGFASSSRWEKMKHSLNWYDCIRLYSDISVLVLISICSGQTLLDNFPFGGSSQGCEVSGNGTNVTLQPNSKYIQGIRQRLQESAESCERREKTFNSFLEQFKAQEAREVKLFYTKKCENTWNT